MLMLAFESSAKAASVALCDNGRLVAQSFQSSGLTHSRTLLPMAEDLLKNAELKLSDSLGRPGIIYRNSHRHFNGKGTGLGCKQAVHRSFNACRHVLEWTARRRTGLCGDGCAAVGSIQCAVSD